MIRNIRNMINSRSDFDVADCVAAVRDFQLKNNPLWRVWYQGMIKNGSTRRRQAEIFLPIELFKRYEIKSYTHDSEGVFLSSGTTGTARSQHFIDDLQAYHQRTRRCFSHAFGDVDRYRHLFFLPFYRTNPQSSLLEMTNHFLTHSKTNGSMYIDAVEQIQTILRLSSMPTILWTVTYGAMDLLEHYSSLDHDRLIIIETGGSKGQRNVLPRTILHAQLEKLGQGIVASSEYGMCELSSQAYYQKGSFHCPPGFYAHTTEIDDPLTPVQPGRPGRLCFVDLANVHSCAFIETQDIGRINPDGSFDVMGRLEASDLRGCNLMYEK